MNRYDRYFKKNKLGVNDKLYNTYVEYNTGYSKHNLISNGCSIIMVNDIPDNFTKNETLSKSIISFFENYIDKNGVDVLETTHIDIIKDKLTDNNTYNINKDYCIDYDVLKSICSIIGGKKINVITSDRFYHPIIEIIGKDMQVGYLLPCRRY